MVIAPSDAWDRQCREAVIMTASRSTPSEVISSIKRHVTHHKGLGKSFVVHFCPLTLLDCSETLQASLAIALEVLSLCQFALTATLYLGDDQSSGSSDQTGRDDIQRQVQVHVPSPARWLPGQAPKPCQHPVKSGKPPLWRWRGLLKRSSLLHGDAIRLYGSGALVAADGRLLAFLRCSPVCPAFSSQL